MNYRITNNTLKILDSCKIQKDLDQLLNTIRLQFPDYNIFKRTNQSLIEEWDAHNFLYELGLFKDHTKDVDFEYPQKWYYKLAYKLLSKCHIFLF